MLEKSLEMAMRNWAILVLAIVGCLKAEALYFGNIGEAEIIEEGMFLSKDNWMALKAGYQGDISWDRKLRAHKGANCEIDQFRIFMNQGVLTLNFADRVDVYGNVGTMNAYVSHRPRIEGTRYKREYQSYDHFTWGYGARGILFCWDHTLIGIGAAIQYAHLPMEWESLNGETFNVPYHKTKLKYNEWQIGGSIAQRIEILTPYFVLEYSRVRAHMKHIPPELLLPKGNFKMNNRVYVGLCFGCTISMGNLFDLNIETRWIDEQSASLAANVKF